MASSSLVQLLCQGHVSVIFIPLIFPRLLFFSPQIKSERYSRFTLQPAEDGERHVEVKLSDGNADDTTEVTTEVEGTAGGSPSFRPAPPRQSRRHIYYLALATLLIFVTGRSRPWFQQEQEQEIIFIY